MPTNLEIDDNVIELNSVSELDQLIQLSTQVGRVRRRRLLFAGFLFFCFCWRSKLRAQSSELRIGLKCIRARKYCACV